MRVYLHWMYNLRVLFLVFTYRGERIRPITGWDAGKKLREAYFRREPSEV